MNDKPVIERKTVTPCYDHLGGVLGAALFSFLLRNRWIEKSGRRGYDITKKGWKELHAFGVDVVKLQLTKRKLITSCTERHGGIFYEHTGAYLGRLLTEQFLEFRWLVKKKRKQFEMTRKGLKGLRALDIKTFKSPESIQTSQP